MNFFSILVFITNTLESPFFPPMTMNWLIVIKRWIYFNEEQMCPYSRHLWETMNSNGKQNSPTLTKRTTIDHLK